MPTQNDIDQPNERDYHAEHVLGSPTSGIFDSFSLFDQAAKIDDSIGMDQAASVKCTAFGPYGIAKIANILEHLKKIEADPDKGWELQKKYGTYGLTGDLVQTGLNSIRDNGMQTKDGTVYPIDNYAQVDHSLLKNWITQGKGIVTSSIFTATNFKIAEKSGIWGGKDGPVLTGHCFGLVGYRPGYFQALQSAGPTWGRYGNGTFWISESDLYLLGTTYVLYDHKDPIELFKDLTSESWAYPAMKALKDAGLIKGYPDGSVRPNNGMTRAEVMQFGYNILHFLGKI